MPADRSKRYAIVYNQGSAGQSEIGPMRQMFGLAQELAQELVRAGAGFSPLFAQFAGRL
jgi:hypothetical protein